MNKKGYSIGFTWVFALVSLFGIGILYIVFNQVFVANLVPTVKDLVNGSTGIIIPEDTKSEINTNIDKYMQFFHALPYILFFVIVLYMLIAAFRKEGETNF